MDETRERLLVGRYRLHDMLGQGGMGTVWRATDEVLARTVAVKRVRMFAGSATEADTMRRRFLREAQISAALHHPNVVSVFDVVTEQDEPWLVLEFVPSRSLSDVLAERGTLPPGEVAAIGAQLAAALATAHAAGIVHRDVKPGNVLMVDAARGTGPGSVSVKLTDFGISHAVDSPTLTGTGLVSGTPAYLAPETARGAGTDQRSDVYALGATLYEALTGHPPFGHGDGNVFALIARIGGAERPPPPSGPLGSVLGDLTAGEPATRPDAAQAFRTLADLAGGVGMTVHLPPPTPPRRRRRPLLIGLAVLAVLAVVGAGAAAALLLARPGPMDPPPVVAGPAAPTVPITIADPRTADPCSLVDPAVLQPFGPTGAETDVIDFSACQLTLNRGDNETYVTVTFLTPNAAGTPAGGRPEQRGTVTLVRFDATKDNCSRRLLLTDRTQVLITFDGNPSDALDSCAVAETSAESALRTLADRGIGTRVPLDTTSPLAAVDACTLLDDSGLAAVPGVDPAAPRRGFGGWVCTWSTPAADDSTSVRLLYFREFALDNTDGRAVDLSGRTAYVEAEEAQDGCTTSVPQRRFTSGGTNRVEVVWVTVRGDLPVEQMCDQSVAVAGALVPRLPPPS